MLRAQAAVKMIFAVTFPLLLGERLPGEMIEADLQCTERLLLLLFPLLSVTE
jgi:hypothetical protein